MNGACASSARSANAARAFAGVIACWASLAFSQQNAGTGDVAAPIWKVGQSWSYVTTADPRDKQLKRPRFEWSSKVDSVGEDYVVTTTGTDADDAVTSTDHFTKSLGVNQQLDDQTNVFHRIAFPLKVGTKWDSKNLRIGLSGYKTETTLSCEAGAIEKVKVPAGEFDAVPITCKGRWRNLAFGNTDQAKEAYWYAPAVGTNVKFEVETWFRGSVYAKFTAVLTAQQPGS
jgi:hypothetical protein